MKFYKVNSKQEIFNTFKPNSCYLVHDRWDDYHFKTTFNLYFTTSNGDLRSIGLVKITYKDQQHGATALPESPFKKLGENYCSLGQEQSYYEELMSLDENVRNEILRGLRDCVFDLSIFELFRREDAMINSLLRNLETIDVEEKFRGILTNGFSLTPYHFNFTLNNFPNCIIDVSVKPGSVPPTNLHVLIGRNGIGKTRILSGIADELTNNNYDEKSISLPGTINFKELGSSYGRFANLISVVFSAFDQFTPIKPAQVRGNIRYHYVGLKKFFDKGDNAEVLRMKSLKNLTDEFRDALEVCINSTRQPRLVEAIQFLNSDPIFAEYKLDQVIMNEYALDNILKIFEKLSSGHKITLLSIVRLVELVEERTLVLIDEPENHLHPPLLASYMRAISDLLIKRNGVALIATHSPVVLQEVPASCVTIVDRIKSVFSFYRPELETFGENVGTLTREVFRLEVKESGYNRIIENHVNIHESYDELLNAFDSQLGSEARAIARSRMANKLKMQP